MKLSEKPILSPEPASTPHFFITDNGIFPNSILPVILYKNAFSLPNNDAPGIIEEVFDDHQWTNSWRDGIYDYDHYHSNTHEVLGIYSGDCQIRLGGENGLELFVEKGDVLIIPAGVAHRSINASVQFKCVGAYPDGREFDTKFGKAEERPEADENIANVPLPQKDPLYGNSGCLFQYWNMD